MLPFISASAFCRFRHKKLIKCLFDCQRQVLSCIRDLRKTKKCTANRIVTLAQRGRRCLRLSQNHSLSVVFLSSCVLLRYTISFSIYVETTTFSLGSRQTLVRDWHWFGISGWEQEDKNNPRMFSASTDKDSIYGWEFVWFRLSEYCVLLSEVGIGLKRSCIANRVAYSWNARVSRVLEPIPNFWLDWFAELQRKSSIFTEFGTDTGLLMVRPFFTISCV